MSTAARNNVRTSGAGTRTMLFAHGFGCDQGMWRFVAPAFRESFRTVLFDHVGAGGSDAAAFDPVRHAAIDGYADDLVEIGRELGLRDAVFVGHSVSCMIGILAAQSAPELFSDLVLVCPSPRYIDDGDYLGGFTPSQVDELLEAMSNDHMAWSGAMAPVIVGNPDRPELAAELAESFCRTDPEIARSFARVTFASDNRADLASVQARTLILQCRDDVIAPASVGEYVHRQIARSTLVHLNATGHCPNLSAPAEVVAAICAFV